eukprot:NODE_8086_length_1524_cov_6.335719.p1 GENE.NODE_8086_length_1524_cov_6.335719~~NODE_8086_length_1524_cov_6.335719.p1  ORF type:complete len:288 (+),score=63.09 NODE_8086_length_1524_cov_6.335719:207-1070(+)
MENLQAHLRRRGLGPEGERSRNDDAAYGTTGSWWNHSVRASWALAADDGIGAMAVLLCGAAVCWGPRSAALASTLIAAWCVSRVAPPLRRSKGVRVVCISDTHGKHRELRLPAGDILVHAGDFTEFGSRDHAVDFNAWLGDQPFKTRIVVNGNHENKAEWRGEVDAILSNATFLRGRSVTVCGLTIYGTEFCWPMREESPIYAEIPRNTDIVIAHGPAAAFVDGRHGCGALLSAMSRVRPRLVISGHIHGAHGVSRGFGSVRGTTFVNAANCKHGYSLGWEPIVVDL